MDEVTIKGFEYYTINENGEVYTVERYVPRTDAKTYLQRRQLVKTVKNCQTGRMQICLRSSSGKRMTLYLHRLIAVAFVPNPDNLPEINHINGICDDNRPENLEWCTRKHNIRHAFRIGLMHGAKGPEHHNYKGGLSSQKGYKKATNKMRYTGMKWGALPIAEKINIIKQNQNG